MSDDFKKNHPNEKKIFHGHSQVIIYTFKYSG